MRSIRRLMPSVSLNRTSVGLKPNHKINVLQRAMQPQSNQRGIETMLISPFSIAAMIGLNRTSVGLKHAEELRKQGYSDRPQSNQRGIETRAELRKALEEQRPQSNQRGIETAIRDLPYRLEDAASIEPAWD